MSLNAGNGLPVLLLIGAIILFRRHRRTVSRAKHQLQRNQRAVYIWQQWLDPVVELVIVGGVIWADLQQGPLPWVAFIIGALAGLPLGIVRGRFMFVRSLGKGSKVVIERNKAEIAILLVLVVIKLIAHAISAKPDSPLNLLAIALLGVGIASSIGRVLYITHRHFNQQPDTQEPTT